MLIRFAFRVLLSGEAKRQKGEFKKKKKIKRQSSDKNKKYFPFSIQMTELKIDLYILYISSPNVGAFLKKCAAFL